MTPSSRDFVHDEDINPWQLTSGRPPARWRVITSNWLSLIAFGHLLAGPLAIAYLYWYASQQGLPMSREPHAYAGPWARSDELGTGVMLLFDFPLRTIFFCVLSLIFKPGTRAAIVLALSFLLGMWVFSMIGLVED